MPARVVLGVFTSGVAKLTTSVTPNAVSLVLREEHVLALTELIKLFYQDEEDELLALRFYNMLSVLAQSASDAGVNSELGLEEINDRRTTITHDSGAG